MLEKSSGVSNYNDFKCFTNVYLLEGYSLDQIKMTEWIWPKLVNMTKKFTTTNINMVNMTKNIINIDTTKNINGWIWPKIHCLVLLTIFKTCSVTHTCQRIPYEILALSFFIFSTLALAQDLYPVTQGLRFYIAWVKKTTLVYHCKYVPKP